MKKLLTICTFILLNCRIGFSQLPNFAVGVRYDNEYETYDTQNPSVTNGLTSNAVKQQGQRSNYGFSINYTLKKRLVFETGVSWIQRHYDQVRAFDAGSTELRLHYTQNYTYDFLEIPISAKFYLARTNHRLKPFIQLGGRANYLKQANYTEYSNGVEHADLQNTYWGWSNYGGVGVQYFWKNFIFETNMMYQFNQKFKHDPRFIQSQWIKFEDNTSTAFSFGGAIYRQLDFRKTK